MNEKTQLQPDPLGDSAILPEHRSAPRTFHVFMLVKSTRRWLDLETPDRLKFLKDRIAPLLRARPEIALRYFEPEAFSARATDILLWETKDLSAWAWLCDHLRDTLFWDHYFEVLDILPSLEADYALAAMR